MKESIEGGEELSGGGDEGDFEGLAGGAEAFCTQLRQYVQTQIDAGRLRAANANAIMFGFMGIVGDAAKKNILFPGTCQLQLQAPDLSEMIELYLDGIVAP